MTRRKTKPIVPVLPPLLESPFVVPLEDIVKAIEKLEAKVTGLFIWLYLQSLAWVILVAILLSRWL